MWNSILKLDTISQIILASGLVACIVLLILGHGYIALFLMLALTLFTYMGNYIVGKERERTYGHVYYQMPDGEMVDVPMEELKKMTKEEGKRLEGRHVSVRFPYLTRLNDSLDTGFGLMVDLSDYPKKEDLSKIKRGTLLAVSGVLKRNDNTWCLHQVKEIRYV